MKLTTQKSFPYLGGMDSSLKNPREYIPANSVAIGGAQAKTGEYHIEYGRHEA